MKIVLVHPYSKTIIDKDAAKIHLTEIDSVDNSSCIAIHLADCMDFVPPEQRNLLLQKAISKLRVGGTLTVSGTSIISVVSEMYHGLITIEQFHAAMFGGRLSMANLNDVLQNLINSNVHIVNYRLDGLYYAITGEKDEQK